MLCVTSKVEITILKSRSEKGPCLSEPGGTFSHLQNMPPGREDMKVFSHTEHISQPAAAPIKPPCSVSQSRCTLNQPSWHYLLNSIIAATPMQPSTSLAPRTCPRTTACMHLSFLIVTISSCSPSTVVSQYQRRDDSVVRNHSDSHARFHHNSCGHILLSFTEPRLACSGF